MRILIDIGHPAHVHLFKNFARHMTKNGHTVLFTCREKEFEIDLLKKYGFNYYSLGKKYRSATGKMFGLIKFNTMILLKSLAFKPDIFLSHGSPYTSHVSAVLRKINIALEDTGNDEQVKLYLPFTRTVLTSTTFHKDYGNKQIRYNGFHELAYLHPNKFVADKSVLNTLSIKDDEAFFIVRFVSWNATHDIGESGLTLKEKIEVINYLRSKGKVFISSEKDLPKELLAHKLNLEPSKIHHLMAFATLFIGEGATMASEAAVLGTPAIYVNSISAGTIDSQAKYGLVHHFKNGKGVIEKIIDLLNSNDLKSINLTAKKKLIEDSIDVTDFLVWFIENYPNSQKIMKEQPNYDLKFK